jgi:hypothetical protein
MVTPTKRRKIPMMMMVILRLLSPRLFGWEIFLGITYSLEKMGKKVNGLDFRLIVVYNPSYGLLMPAIIMRKKTFIISSITLLFAFAQVKHLPDVFTLGKHAFAKSPLSPLAKHVDAGTLLASHVMPLNDRYPVQSVSDVFRDNILLTLHYMSGQVSKPSQINWDEIRKPYIYEFVLKPGEVFAFHDDVLPSYQGKVVMTTKSHYNAQEGFLSDGYLFGDGVCHFASLMNWVASDAGLQVEAPTNHNFANIPDVPMTHGTAIYSSPGQSSVNELQNLYITNTSDKDVKFVFEYGVDQKLKLSVYKLN